MCDRLNSLVCNDRLNTQLRLWHPRVVVKDVNTVCLRFASFNVPYDPVRLMYKKRPACIQFLILPLMVQKIRY